MEEVKVAFYNNKFINIKINYTKDYLISLSFEDKENNRGERDSFSNLVFNQLNQYFEAKRFDFDIPLYFENYTPFEQSVFKALIDIPYGEVRSYKDIAIRVNHPKAYRAVGSANHKNPIPIIIPCHRVIASNNKIGGYGYGVKLKEQLLKLENSSFYN